MAEMSSTQLQILVLEGRDGVIRALLAGQPGLAVRHADKVAAVERMLPASRFQAVLIDLSPAGAFPPDAVRSLLSLLPGVPILALTDGGGTGEFPMDEGIQALLDKRESDPRMLMAFLRQAVLRTGREQRRFRSLFDSAPLGILLAAGRRIVMANPSALEIIAHREGDLARLSVLDLFPPKHRPALEKALDACGRNGAEGQAGGNPGFRFRSSLRTGNGSAVACRIFAKEALLNDAPVLALYLAADEDEDADDAASPGRVEHFRQTNKMAALGRLAGGIAHDFNNLLTAINGYSEHLLSLTGSEGALTMGLRAIRKAGDAAAVLTRSLLTFSRVDGEPARPVRVDSVIDEIAPMLRKLLGKDIEFRVRPGAGAAMVRLDPGQLEQIVMNLCANARDAMPRGGFLVLATETVRVGAGNPFTHLAAEEGEHILISVEDNGTGMGKETLECLFEPYYTTKDSGKGTGLGLATVYGIVSKSGGGISVSSRPGQGSHFRIYLACTEDVPAAPAPSAVSPAWSAEGNRETILVVEDESSLRDMLKTVLERYGFTVLEAVSGDEAIAVLADRPGGVDLILSDVVLRVGMGGPDLVDRIRADHPGIRAVFISGHSVETLADRGIRVPGDAFLEKPFKPSQLAYKVREVLDAAGKLR